MRIFQTGGSNEVFEWEESSEVERWEVELGVFKLNMVMRAARRRKLRTRTVK